MPRIFGFGAFCFFSFLKLQYNVCNFRNEKIKKRKNSLCQITHINVGIHM